MASITTTRANGRRLLQFVAADNRRRSIRLGKVSMRQAEKVRTKVEDLLASTITGHAASRATSEWLSDLDDALYERLAAVGLVQPRRRVTLGPFIDDYIAARTDVKATTATVYRRGRQIDQSPRQRADTFPIPSAVPTDLKSSVVSNDQVWTKFTDIHLVKIHRVADAV